MSGLERDTIGGALHCAVKNDAFALLPEDSC